MVITNNYPFYYDSKKATPRLLDSYAAIFRADDFSAVGGLKPTPEAIQFLHDGLGFPVYFIVFISYAKLLGSIAILVPGLNRHIKEWAYAGLFFDLAGAIYSGVAVAGKFDPMMLTLLAWILPGVVSYYCWLKKEGKGI